MASAIMNSFNAMFNELFEALEPLNTGNVQITKLKVENVEKPKTSYISKNNSITKVEVKKEVKPKVEESVVIDTIKKEEPKPEVMEAEVVIPELPIALDNPEPVDVPDDKINCPIKIQPAVEKMVKIDVTNHPKVKIESSDEGINSICTDLDNIGIKFTDVKRVPSGLVELDLILNNGTKCTISVDADCKIYNDDIRIFFIGKVTPGAEYNMAAFIFAADSIRAVFNGQYIPANFCVPVQRSILNRMLDIRTLKETDKEKRISVLNKVSKVFETMNDDIVTAAKGEQFRFAIAKYKSENEFSLVSSNKNVVSNLSDDKLLTTKEIWIDVKKKDLKLYTK